MIPIEFTNALRRFPPRIDELLMEVAISRCGSTIPIEFTHGLRHSSISRKRIDEIEDTERTTYYVDRRVTDDFAVSRRDSTIPIEFTNGSRNFSLRMELAISRCE